MLTRSQQQTSSCVYTLTAHSVTVKHVIIFWLTSYNAANLFIYPIIFPFNYFSSVHAFTVRNSNSLNSHECAVKSRP